MVLDTAQSLIEVPEIAARLRPLAAGIPFAAVDGEGVVGSGVQLLPDEGGRVRVTWAYRRGERPVDVGEADLRGAAEVLGSAGWDALLYRAGRGRFLLVEPGRTA